MTRGLIITLPRHDDVTEYLSFFSKSVISEAEDRSVPFKKLEDGEANKKDFEKVVQKRDYKLIVFNGHGTPTSICGYGDLPIVEEKVNDKILADKITYARSCDSACSLGLSIFGDCEKGCFIGYDLPFQFYCDKTWVGNPAKDMIAPLFLEPSNAVPIFILKGKTVREAYESSRRAMLKNMKKALRRADAESLAIAEALWNNYDGQVLIGDGSVKLDSS